ncbi:AraC family transcriptional regulator [Cohnella zeiphila]|uniref:HTH araC/xylS-type domain-containing protein n=1 Tax=Cohnella zeiphila TaxID=2761120 RepID=A0A7X0SRZ6_9BACL|nr:hypothetical protein [Cohnella zeiphila]MBB6734024.1 hypothetical protein [Cohnella zeiphila]
MQEADSLLPSLNWGTFPNHIPQMYQHSLKAIRQQSSRDREFFIELRDSPGRWDAARDKVESIFEELEQAGKGHNELLLEVFLHISHAYSFIAHKQGRMLSEVIGPDYERFDSRLSFYSVHQLREWSLRLLDKINVEFSSEAKSSRRYIIEQMQKYVHEHLSEAITLQTLADHVQLHPVYVSRIFKLETEEKISDYILRLKMEKAQHLLFNGDLRIYQIAERVAEGDSSQKIVLRENVGIAQVHSSDRLRYT